MNAAAMLIDLRAHQNLCRELLTVVERERRLLHAPEVPSLAQLYETKRALLPRLNQSLEKVREHRFKWVQADATERSGQPEVTALIRQVQDLIMRVIVMDRENEQSLLRRGLMAPGQLPSANQQRPNFVAQLYRQSAPAASTPVDG